MRLLLARGLAGEVATAKLGNSLRRGGFQKSAGIIPIGPRRGRPPPRTFADSYAPSADTTLEKTFWIWLPIVRRMTMTTIDTRTRIKAYSTMPWPYCLSVTDDHLLGCHLAVRFDVVCTG